MNHLVQEKSSITPKSAIRAEATTGVIPPANSAVDPNRFSPPIAIMTALFKGADFSTFQCSRTSSYTWTMMAPRVLADGRTKVKAANETSIWTYSFLGLPAASRMRYTASRWARPD